MIRHVTFGYLICRWALVEYKSTADRLNRCQLRSPVSGINIWWSAAMLFAHRRRDLYSAARPSRRNYLITIWCVSVSGCGDTCGNWESLRDWLSVPPFTCAFLKSPSSRGLSAIAELLVIFAVFTPTADEIQILVDFANGRYVGILVFYFLLLNSILVLLQCSVQAYC